jgi:hypothetical protein
MSSKSPYRTDRHVTRPCEANTGTFKCAIEPARLEALGGDRLSLVLEERPKPRRCLDDMRKLSEEIKRNRQLQKQTIDGPGSENADNKDEVVEMRLHQPNEEES